MKRACGVLMPVASLPSEYGIGCFDEAAYEFVDRLAEAGQSYWQVLPMGPTGYGDSPYQSFSTFAGNPYFISLRALIKKGYLTADECAEIASGTNDQIIKYDFIYDRRFKLLRKAFEKSAIETDQGFADFVRDNEEWLSDYALYMAIKDDHDGKSYLEWEEDIKTRKPDQMVAYRNKLINDVTFYQFLQYEFYTQWGELKEYANQKGIRIIGDIPIYVALDSADTWAHPELFKLDEDRNPIAVAGCPPDAFSEDGQLWGNPLYDWDAHREDGFEWWVSRIKKIYELFDVVRIDHFRGFDEYYSIPYGERTARNGEWLPGPGLDVFRAAKRNLGDFDVIAEDLGFLTDSVIEMRENSGFPGMKILQFAFDSREESDYLPYKYDRNCVVYTGTHDNSTTYAWIGEMSAPDKKKMLEYVGTSVFTGRKKLTWKLIGLALASVADLCIIPMQDYLCLDNLARINTPSTLGFNWQWRMKKNAFSEKLTKRMLEVAKLYGRIPLPESEK
ncbi:MAG: 4-alpha-glucanotransferase [Eubacterium sp.]|nr:4-alpha-glucanotransferase [Eubacterium sp.]